MAINIGGISLIDEVFNNPKMLISFKLKTKNEVELICSFRLISSSKLFIANIFLVVLANSYMILFSGLSNCFLILFKAKDFFFQKLISSKVSPLSKSFSILVKLIISTFHLFIISQILLKFFSSMKGLISSTVGYLLFFL